MEKCYVFESVLQLWIGSLKKSRLTLHINILSKLLLSFSFVGILLNNGVFFLRCHDFLKLWIPFQLLWLFSLSFPIKFKILSWIRRFLKSEFCLITVNNFWFTCLLLSVLILIYKTVHSPLAVSFICVRSYDTQNIFCGYAITGYFFHNAKQSK